MKAVILAAGKGTRMRTLTDERPKPMLLVHGQPILAHIIAGLKSAGILDLFIITGFKAEAIEGHFGDGRAQGVRLAYGRQTVQDGTGKAPEVARDFVGDSPFLLTYGDILVRPETYQRMVARYQQGDCAGVIAATPGEDVTKGAILLFDPHFFLKHLIEKPSLAQLDQLRQQGWLKPGEPLWYNSGIYLFPPAVFEFTARLKKSPRGEYELTDAVTALIEARHRLAGLAIEGRWVDVRDPEVLARLEAESRE